MIEPLGFQINDTQLKRAGLDYWKHVNVSIHPNLEKGRETIPKESDLVFFSNVAQASYIEHRFKEGTYLFFGNETAGLAEELRKNYADRFYRIPQYDDRVRSLNLANAVSIVVYEAIRQLGP